MIGFVQEFFSYALKSITICNIKAIHSLFVWQ